MQNAVFQAFPPFPREDWHHHREAIDLAMRRVASSGQYVLCKEVAAFETEWAEYLGAGRSVGVASGTDAIEVMIRALGMGRGDKVVIPAFAPSAVATGVTRAGVEPLFADCDAETLCLCPVSLNALLDSPAGHGVKAAVVVHLFGQMANWEELSRVADVHGIELLEDASQAHGAERNGRKAGTLGRASAFSFYPTKNLAAMGDGGAVVCSDNDVATQALLIREYGWRERYVSELAGMNSRLDELQAAILRAKLATLDCCLRAREELAARYSLRLGQLEHLVARPVVSQGVRHGWHQYVVRSPRRDALRDHLISYGVPAAVHYPAPLHRQPAYAQKKAMPVPLRNAETAATGALSLPLHPYLSLSAVDRVCDLIESF